MAAGIEAHKAALGECETKVGELAAAYRRSKEELAAAQARLDAANSKLADAEVALIMAEIDSH